MSEGAPRDAEGFLNLGGAPAGGKSLFQVLKWRLAASARKPWPSRVENAHVADLSAPAAGELAATGINHATVLLRFDGMTVLTDPVYSERVSPVSWAGPRRVRAPGASFDDLPKIDLVVVSHNHYDHMDLPTLARLRRRDRPRFLVPLGNARHLRSAGIDDAVELDWWREFPLGGGASATLTPAHHWSARSPWDRRRALWGGFVLRAGGTSAYFAGDTGEGPHFAMIRERLGAPDLALLPIGAYEPRWFMRAHHIDPQAAAAAHRALGARASAGIHFGTFQLSDEGIDDPVTELSAARKARGIPEDEFPALHNGLTLRLARP